MSAPDDPAPAVVMGLSPTGLHVVRTLGRAGVPVIGLGEPAQPGRLSRYLTRCITLADPAGRLAALEALAPETPEGQPGRPVLIPTSDQDVDFVITHAERLARRFAFQRSYRDGLAAAMLSKDSFYALCAAHGIAYPRLWSCTRDALPGLVPDLRFPVLIKPARLHAIKHRMGGRKGWALADAGALQRILPRIPDGAGTLLVQEIVPGPESAITLWCAHVDDAGVPRQSFTARKLRQFPPGFGSASLVQGAPEPETAAITARFLQALGYHGIAAAEFKRHPETGALALIEINVRPSLWFALTSACGRDVVLAAWRELAGLPAAPEIPQRDGLRWCHALKDLASALFYRLRPGFLLPPPDIGCLGPVRERVWAVFAPDDPLPALGELGSFLAKALKRLAKFGDRGAG